eukprot:TRINITY_DN4302_c0_g1_i1.p1 TRINITY_DN4302_c0_g1~~TRINITY_DN4302_c0_g1_i1.p1  ORF type:complete len:188 (+),score=67.70 TRINITY_DN4302_c0_g1_i1:32-565(+)
MLRRMARTAAARCFCTPPASASQDPFAHLFPELSQLAPDRLKVAAGHLHLVAEDGWGAGEFTWNIAESFDNCVFTAAGHQWQLDLAIRREASPDMQEGTMTGATFRIYSLRRLTPGHPIPIRVVATLKDSTGGSKCETNDFYTPLQSDAVDEESFEVLRFSELDKEYQKVWWDAGGV